MESEIAREVHPPIKSTFVSVTAWVFIVFGGFSTLISILQNIMIYLLFPKAGISTAMNQATTCEKIPFIARFAFNNINLIFLLFLIISATCFLSAIALLKRKNWARIFFIVILSLGIFWNIAGFCMQLFMFSSAPEMSKTATIEFVTMMNIMKIATGIMAVGLSSLFAWIIFKLNSTVVKAEFA